MTAQASLFDAPLIDPTAPSPARHSDPQTSHDAARSVPARKGRASMRRRLLAAYGAATTCGEALTADEAGAIVGIEHYNQRRRTSELLKCGLLEAAGTAEGPSGHAVSCYRVTEAGWVELGQ